MMFTGKKYWIALDKPQATIENTYTNSGFGVRNGPFLTAD
jgi:hypothetical protein